jgi:exodeoxyribonuclease-3
MRIISLSVDGIVQAAQRGLFTWLQKQDADIICLQDLRTSEDRLDSDIYFPQGYCAYFCDKADGDRGVVIYTKQMPQAVMQGFGYSPQVDLDGVYIRADFEQFSVVSLMVPPATLDPQSLESRMRFLDELKLHFQKISNKRRKYIFCCNWNMAHQKGDIQNWEANQASPGFLPFERQWLNELYNEEGYADVLRVVSSDRGIYSWWPSGTVDKGDGWRVDAQVVSAEFVPLVQKIHHYRKHLFSSHLPVIADYDMDSD